MAHRKQNTGDQISTAFIRDICMLYGDHYDDRLEDSRPPAAGSKDGQTNMRQAGADWEPGQPAEHKSLKAFQKELLDEHGIRLSTSKIRKILISGGLWTTERSREIQMLYAEITQKKSDINPEQAVTLISQQLDISKPTVVVNLPYINGVNCLKQKSKNAKRCEKYREKKKHCEYSTNQSEKLEL